jgi:hypothetical protein
MCSNLAYCTVSCTWSNSKVPRLILSRKFGLAHKPVSVYSCYDPQGSVKWKFQPCRFIRSRAVRKLCFALLSGSWEQTSSFVWDPGNQLQKHMKRLELFTEMKLYVERMSLNGLVDSERDARNLKMTQPVVGCCLLEIREQLHKVRELWARECRRTDWCSLNLIHLIYIYLTAVGLTPGGSSTSHIYTQTVHIIQRKKNWEVRAVPRLCELYPGIALQLRKQHGKTQLR